MGAGRDPADGSGWPSGSDVRGDKPTQMQGLWELHDPITDFALYRPVAHDTE